MNKFELAKQLRISPLSMVRLLRQGFLGGIKTATPNKKGQWFVSSKDFHMFLFKGEEYPYKKLGFGSLKVKNLNIQ